MVQKLTATIDGDDDDDDDDYDDDAGAAGLKDAFNASRF